MTPLRERRCVRIFLSVDLVGSTAFKTRTEKDTFRYKDGPPWANVFDEFYRGFPSYFQRNMDGESLGDEIRPTLVKTIGDELLLQTVIDSHKDAQAVFCFFAKAIAHYETHNLNDSSLLLKGAAWIAGFPINNYRVNLGDGRDDFIGPSIDAGFRLAKLATPSKLTVSVDLAQLLLEGQMTPALHFDRMEPLKGVLGERPYPIIWHHIANVPGDMLGHELRVQDKRAADPKALQDLCGAYIENCRGTWLIRPYFDADEVFGHPPEWHQRIIEMNRREDEKVMIGQDESDVPAAP